MADIAERDRNVRFVPKAGSCTAAILSLFDYRSARPSSGDGRAGAEYFRDF